MLEPALVTSVGLRPFGVTVAAARHVWFRPEQFRGEIGDCGVASQLRDNRS
jgi:hypothetical protein